MTDVPNQRDWRKVFQNKASDLKVEAAIVSGQTERKAAIIGQSQVVVGAVSTQLIAANAARISFLVKNISSVDVYVYLGTPATLANGILLEEGDSLFGDCYTGIITGIRAAVAATVSVIEV